MLLKIGYDITYELARPTPMVLMLYVHPERAGDLVEPDRILIEPDVPVRDFVDHFGNRCARLMAPAGALRLSTAATIEDNGSPEPHDINAAQHPVDELPDDALPFLLASRYCEVDRLSHVAWELFGKLPPGMQRAQAVCDWVQKHVEFGYAHARVGKTALDTYLERKGVCRDLNHLAITLCRALNIPARYATGYLGDINVPHDPTPMDFSAFFEVYLDHRWWPLDARHNAQRIGRVLMARGRDATDVALTTSFGPHRLVKFAVTTDAV
ncbi:MAG: transglutaminase-like domain-containing protein [Tepidisphaeraceae bacterium]